MKPIPVFSNCPHCRGPLQIRQLECSSCDLSLRAHFELNPLIALGDEDLRFIRLFLHCEGSIRDMEKSLGISYPTVKARLAAINSNLEERGTATNKSQTFPTDSNSSRDVLDQLADGEVDFETALKSFKKGKSHAK